MNGMKEQLKELVALAQLYISQTYSLEEKLIVEREECDFYRKWVKERKPQQQPDPPKPLPQAPTRQQPPPREKTAPSTPPQIDREPQKERIALVAEPPPKEQKKKSPLFALEPPPKPVEPDFTHLRKTMQEHFPHLQLIDAIPDDREAKWKEKSKVAQILILSLDEPPKQQAFLSRLSAALQIHNISCTVSQAHQLEVSHGWEAVLSSPHLQLLIVCHHQIQRLPGLMKHYREESKQAKYYFGKIPTLLLPDITVYFNEPSLKSALWKAIQSLV